MAETLWIDGPRRKSLDKAEEFRRKGRKSRWKKMQRIQISEDQGLTQEAKKRAKEKEDTSEDTTISVADQGVKEGAIDVEKTLNFTGHLLRDAWGDTKEFKEWYQLPHNIGAVGARGIESFFTIDADNPKEVALELIQKVANPRKGVAGSIISEVPGVKQAINQLDEITQPIRTNIRTALTGPRLQPAYEAIGVQPRGILQQGVDDALGNNVFAFSKKSDAIEYYKKNPPFGGEDYVIKNSASTANPNWTPKRKANLEAQRLRRIQRLEELNASYAPEVNVKGQDKIKAIKAKGMDPHHLVPTHISKKLKDSMTPQEWAIRVQEDAARYIYHGDHPRNLVAARRSNTVPRHTAGQKSEIFHRQGKPEEGLSGYHTLERQIKSVLDYDKYRSLMAKQMKNKRQATKFLESLGTFIID